MRYSIYSTKGNPYGDACAIGTAPLTRRRNAAEVVRRAMVAPLALLSVIFSARAQSPADGTTDVPVLRIETGMHTGAIFGIARDRGGTLALTVSADKTARLWELPSGRLLRVLRPPIGVDDSLCGCMLSSDGSIAVVGARQRENHLYVFDSSKGSLVQAVGTGADGAIDLAFSFDGRFLVAGLSGSGGVHVWETTSWREVSKDTGYSGNTLSVDWGRNARVVTASEDGFVRLYSISDSGALHLLAKRKPSVEALPYSVRYSPDGESIAVGFHRSPADVKLLKATDLSDPSPLAPAPAAVRDLSAVDGEFGQVEWSADAAFLAAGGKYYQKGKFGILLRNARGNGKAISRWMASDCITDIRSLPMAGFLFCSSEPTWGLLRPTSGAGWETKILGSPQVANLRNIRNEFLVSKDGGSVSFHYDPDKGSPAIFSIASRDLRQAAPTASSDMLAARTEGLPVTSWVNSYFPLLGGSKLPLENYEGSWALAISEDKTRFVLGTSAKLRMFSSDGKSLWAVAVAAPSWAVNLTANDQVVVAAFGDGTIRWYRADNGRELLAFFPHADRKRWLIWASDYEPQTAIGVILNEKDGRVVVDAVPDGKPAAEAGIKKGDVVIAIDDQSVADVAFTLSAVRRHLPGDLIQLSIVRDGKTMKLTSSSFDSGAGPLCGVYYDCSPGAEDFIGWHVSRGSNHEADYFSASRFRNLYYRPDLIARVLQTRDVAEALRQANAARALPDSKPENIRAVIRRLAPPVVELETGGIFGKITVPAKESSVKVRYRVRQTGSEAPSKVSVRFNGRLVDAAAPLPKEGEIAEANVPLPKGVEGELSVFAEHSLAVSEPAILRIQRKAGAATPARPRLFLVSAGVSKFLMNHPEDASEGVQKFAEIRNPGVGGLILPDLPNAAGDALRLSKSFQVQEGRLYEKVFIQSLSDRAATVAGLRGALEEVARQARSEDVALIFFSGHGVVDPKAGYYLATFEADPKRPSETAMTGTELSRLLEGIKARTVLALDTCHSASALTGAKADKIITSPLDLTGFVNALSSAEEGTIVLSSCAATELSLEDLKMGGLFTVAFREGLAGKAGAGGLVTCKSMGEWLARRLPDLVAPLVEGMQNPLHQTPVGIIPKGVPDFALAKP